MENVEKITWETSPYGPIEMAQDLNPKSAGSNSTNNINWNSVLISVLIVFGSIAIIVVIDSEMKKRNEASKRQQPPANV